MASISLNRRTGRRMVQFIGHDRKRRSIRLGIVTKAAAEEVARWVDVLNGDRITNAAPERRTSEWLAGIGDELRDKLVRVGLCEPKEGRHAPTLGEWLNSWLETKAGAKPNTLSNYTAVATKLKEVIGTGKKLPDVTQADADRFAAAMAAKYASATTRRWCTFASQFFRSAVRDKLIVANPFTELTIPPIIKQPRAQVFVSRATIQRVIDAAPDAEWRAIIALSRFGGIRIPSELLTLKWSYIDWTNKRFVVKSPKTEHHPGGDERAVPLFDELLPYLRDIFDPEAVYVINRYRCAASNIRTMFRAIVKRADVKPWPKAFNNLRSSRQTELEDAGFPSHVVCAWIGNSVAIARKHYLQVTDEHFARAAKPMHPAMQHAPEQAAHAPEGDERFSMDSLHIPARTAHTPEMERFLGREAIDSNANQHNRLPPRDLEQLIACTPSVQVDEVAQNAMHDQRISAALAKAMELLDADGRREVMDVLAGKKIEPAATCLLPLP